METGHWIYPNEFDIDDWFGFVYRIINTINEKEYIGKKQFFSERTKVVKGRKNRKHYKKESDWQSYTGSSTELNSDISLLGKDNFIFLIESLHKTRSSLFYAEIEKQVFENVLREKSNNGEKKYYNKMIAGVKFIPPAEVAEETRMKISTTLLELYSDKNNFWYNQLSEKEKIEWDIKFRRGENNAIRRNKSPEEYEQWLNDNVRGENNPMYGKSRELSPAFGKSLYDYLTDEEIIAWKQKLSLAMSGENNPRYGKSPFEYFTNEQLEEHKKHLSKIMSGENNPMYGRPCHYKMTEEEIIQWKDNISKASKGKCKSAEARANMSKGMKGKKKSIVVCPHCNKSGGSNNMYRYHFDNCKMKNTPV